MKGAADSRGRRDARVHRHGEPANPGRPSQPLRQAGLGGLQRGPSDAWMALVEIGSR